MFLSVILVSLCCRFTMAQKAYERIIYKTSFPGHSAVLTLADGYLPASKVVVHSKHGNQVFTASAAEADDKGEVRFNAVKGSGSYKNRKSSWIVLRGLNDATLPSRIKAVYWDGKVRQHLIFK